MDIKKKKVDRFKFLETLYVKAKGSTQSYFDIMDIGNELSILENDVNEIVSYLIEEHLIRRYRYGDGKQVAIEHNGIIEVEEAIENPATPTEHFLPVNIINNYGSINNSSLQQGGSNSSVINVIKDNKKDDLENIFQQLELVHSSLDTSLELHREIGFEIDTLKSQMQSPKPKKTIVDERLKSTRTLLEGVAINAVSPKLIETISHYLQTS